MTIASAVFSPKVNETKIETAIVAVSPGRAPTTIPRNVATMASKSVFGCNNDARFNTSFMLLSPYSVYLGIGRWSTNWNSTYNANDMETETIKAAGHFP